MIRVEITTDPLAAALARAAAALDDLTPLMQDLGEDLLVATERNFAAGTAPDGTPWAPRSEATLAAYARAKPPKLPAGGPLILTGTMRQTINYEAGADYVEWGSNAIQAAVMQFGAEAGAFGARMGVNAKGNSYFMPIPWGDIPARPYIGIGAEDETALLATIGEYLTDLLGA